MDRLTLPQPHPWADTEPGLEPRNGVELSGQPAAAEHESEPLPWSVYDCPDVGAVPDVPEHESRRETSNSKASSTAARTGRAKGFTRMLEEESQPPAANPADNPASMPARRLLTLALAWGLCAGLLIAYMGMPQATTGASPSREEADVAAAISDPLASAEHRASASPEPPPVPPWPSPAPPPAAVTWTKHETTNCYDNGHGASSALDTGHDGINADTVEACQAACLRSFPLCEGLIFEPRTGRCWRRAGLVSRPHMVHCHTVHLPLGALLIPCTMFGAGWS